MASRRGNRDEPSNAYSKLGFACLSFLAGAFLGSLLVPCLSAGGEGWFADYYGLICSGQAYQSFKSFFISNSLMLLVIFTGAFVRWGVFAVPCVMAAKGFTVSFAVTCYIRAFGAKGYLPAVFAIFFSSFIVVSSFMLLSCQALDYSRLISRRGPGSGFGRIRFDRGYLFSGLIALMLIMAAGVLHCYLMPVFTYMTMGFVK